MEEPSRDEMALRILRKFAVPPPRGVLDVGNVMANLADAGLSFAGLGGIPVADFISIPIDVTVLTIDAVTKEATAVGNAYLKAHPDRVYPLQRRIGTFLDKKSAAIFTPAGNTPKMEINLAGITLGPYFCEAKAIFAKPETSDCAALARLLGTLINVPDEWAQTFTKQLHNPFTWIEEAAKASPKEAAAKQTLKNFRRKFLLRH